jgi:hypothetical protein
VIVRFSSVKFCAGTDYVLYDEQNAKHSFKRLAEHSACNTLRHAATGEEVSWPPDSRFAGAQAASEPSGDLCAVVKLGGKGGVDRWCT